MNAGDDLADVDAVLSGDVDRFEGIVRRWHGPIVNLAYRFCRDRDRAEDMAQDAFVRAYRSLSRWRREAAFSTWLFAVAMNAYRSDMARNPPRLVSLEEVAEHADPQSAGGGAAGERADALRRAVRSLPPKYREALVLFYFHEMDIRSAAQTAGVPEGTLKARLSRGRSLLGVKMAALAPELGTARE